MSDEHVKEFGGADGVDDFEAGRGFERLARRVRQRLAGRDAFLQTRKIEFGGERRHQPIIGRRSEHCGRAEILNGLEQQFGRQTFHQRDRCAETQRKNQQAAESIGERQRRRAANDVILVEIDAGAREAFARRHDVAVEMHRRLGLTGGARSECDQAGIVRGGGDVVEFFRMKLE